TAALARRMRASSTCKLFQQSCSARPMRLTQLTLEDHSLYRPKAAGLIRRAATHAKSGFGSAQLLTFLLVLTAAVGNAADWETGPGFRRLKVEPISSTKDGFTLLDPAKTGILFTNRLSETRGLTSQILPSGSGVAAGDVDGDGLCD